MFIFLVNPWYETSPGQISIKLDASAASSRAETCLPCVARMGEEGTPETH
jgi:hypothetical protein